MAEYVGAKTKIDNQARMRKTDDDDGHYFIRLVSSWSSTVLSPVPLRRTTPFLDPPRLSRELMLFRSRIWLVVLVAQGLAQESIASEQARSRVSMTVGSKKESQAEAETYGVDTSWPTQHEIDSVGRKPKAGSLKFQQQEAYRAYMQGCIAAYNSRDLCVRSDNDRIAMNAAQPAYQTNFTAAGYAKVRAPEAAFDMLQDLWSTHYSDKLVKESWPAGNIYTNHWEVPTEVLQIKDYPTVKRAVEEQVQEVLEAWSGQSLIPTSTYGIRVYYDGSYLVPHVDRLPLVLSAIINVAQEVEEDWVLEVIGHDGVAVNLTMAPGDMVLYESHSVIHGRPFVLRGEHYANMFLHFEPIGYTTALEKKMEGKLTPKSDKQVFEEMSLRDAYTAAAPKDQGRPNLPDYIQDGTQQAVQWLQDYIFYRTESTTKKKTKRTKGVREAHILAASGNVAKLKEIASEDRESLHASDSNGWKPIHEAARSGRVQVLEYLIEDGADVNDRTNEGKGGSPLWWAEHMLPDNHPAIQLLRRNGARAVGPHE